MWLLLIAWLLVGVAGALYLFRFQIRRWWRGNVVNRDLPPHQRWPEILQWRKGDRFDFIGVYGRRLPCGWTGAVLVTVRADATAVCKEYLGSDKAVIPVQSLSGLNQSLKNRRINHSLQSSNEYMELLEAFNQSVKELEERDKKLKLVG